MESRYDARTLEATEDFVKYYQWIVSRVSGAIRGRTLEIGSGIGTMSRRIRPLCSEMVLVEPAVNLHETLARRLGRGEGIVVCGGTLASAASDDPALFAPGFDTIVSFNVLEHIEDDTGVLRMAGTMLRPGGLMVIFVPGLPWLYGSVDAQVDHQRRYTSPTLGRTIEAAGLQVRSIEYFDMLGIVPWFVMGRVLRRTSRGGGVKSYDRAVVPVCRALDRLVGPPIGKNLIAIAGRSDG